MAKFLPYKQGSTEWLLARVGILSASRMADCLAVTKKGPSEKRISLMYEILSERRTGMAAPNFTSKEMEWGTAQEPFARSRYEEVTGELVEVVGLAMHDTIEFWGASCDGLVGDYGCVEFKCPSSKTMAKYQYEDEIPEMYKPQMMTQLIITGREWCDFFAYDPRIQDYSTNYFLKRYTPTAEELATCQAAAELFLSEVNALHQQIIGK